MDAQVLNRLTIDTHWSNANIFLIKRIDVTFFYTLQCVIAILNSSLIRPEEQIFYCIQLASLKLTFYIFIMALDRFFLRGIDDINNGMMYSLKRELCTYIYETLFCNHCHHLPLLYFVLLWCKFNKLLDRQTSSWHGGFRNRVQVFLVLGCWVTALFRILNRERMRGWTRDEISSFNLVGF